jgi:hypothetical protein
MCGAELVRTILMLRVSGLQADPASDTAEAEAT